MLVFAPSSPVFAAALPQIALSVSQASPGATIEVMGGRFPEDAVVKFMLHSPQNEIPLGTITADDHGEFSVAVLIPSDVKLGDYEFQAIDEQNQMAIAPVSIIADTSGQDGSDQREDSDGLLAPMPTIAPGTASTPPPQSATFGSPASKGTSVTLIFSVLLGAGIIALLSIRILKKR
jgi:hypothetical protein